MLKWILLIIVGLLVVAVGYRFYTRDDFNAAVADEIRAEPNAARAQKTMLLTLEDGRAYPVNYLEENGLVFMGIDGLWWREFLGDGAPVKMLIRGEELTGHARTVLDDPAYKEDIFSRLRPTVPEWLPDWLNGKLVVITPSS